MFFEPIVWQATNTDTIEPTTIKFAFEFLKFTLGLLKKVEILGLTYVARTGNLEAKSMTASGFY